MPADRSAFTARMPCEVLCDHFRVPIGYELSAQRDGTSLIVVAERRIIDRLCIRLKQSGALRTKFGAILLLAFVPDDDPELDRILTRTAVCDTLFFSAATPRFEADLDRLVRDLYATMRRKASLLGMIDAADVWMPGTLTAPLRSWPERSRTPAVTVQGDCSHDMQRSPTPIDLIDHL